jgi:hypothetical protein
MPRAAAPAPRPDISQSPEGKMNLQLKTNERSRLKRSGVINQI